MIYTILSPKTIF